MSIRGIDTQIMITRATDLVRETSSIQKQPEFTQEHLAAQSIIERDEDQTRVSPTTESEMEEIDVDPDGKGSGASGEDSGEEEEMTEEQKRELLVAPADHDQLIDIYL